MTPTINKVEQSNPQRGTTPHLSTTTPPLKTSVEFTTLTTPEITQGGSITADERQAAALGGLRLKPTDFFAART